MDAARRRARYPGVPYLEILIENLIFFATLATFPFSFCEEKRKINNVWLSLFCFHPQAKDPSRYTICDLRDGEEGGKMPGEVEGEQVRTRGGRGSDFLDLNQSESFYFWIWVGSGRIRIDFKNLNLLTLSLKRIAILIYT